MAKNAQTAIAQTEAPETATPTVAVRPRKFAETAVITVNAKTNPKRGASAARFAVYLAPRETPLTVKDYLDACAELQPDEPRYRWLADLSWDSAAKRGFISVA